MGAITEEILEKHGWALGSVCFPTFVYRKEGMPSLGGAYSESPNLEEGHLIVYGGNNRIRIETEEQLVQFEYDYGELV